MALHEHAETSYFEGQGKLVSKEVNSGDHSGYFTGYRVIILGLLSYLLSPPDPPSMGPRCTKWSPPWCSSSCGSAARFMSLKKTQLRKRQAEKT